ncbi:C4-dicarboxylate TRAP transporter substrate-binding protein [Albimonas pacifica]|uniref:TRAP-type C4-dicarboxylate transport system, substrate-binding protein n=1 Tax=Albimonas pacifica TaxID=1114924 RepID=A0A1I3L3W6_9RHOB|nr:C4-dicarboxylate TRAP transporter substrate-binding protein [Albimonas pacifica]SFI79401.1 TRAP-type C4-dicarboxylate transport system, substrate-binding protein [Albimonas pacifica]
MFHLKPAAGAAAFAISASVSALAATPALAAENLRFAIGWPPGSSAEASTQHFADVAAEESGGDLQVKVYPLSLLNFLESTSGVRDGVADLTTVLTPYFITEFPEMNYATELASLAELEDGDPARNVMAYNGALMEYIFFDCPDCQAELEAQNHVYLTGSGSQSYFLQCTRPVSSVEDLQGLRVRAGGAFWARWATAMGATAVSMSINETFEGLSQGVVDCVAASAPELTNFGFIDVVTDMTPGVPGGSFVSGVAQMNRERWGEMSEANKVALLKASAALSAQGVYSYYEVGNANMAMAREKGVAIHEPSAELVEKTKAWIQADAEALGATYAERFGLKDAEAKLAKLRELMAKWSGLTAGVETEAQLRRIYWDNLHSKIDVATYGQ